MWVGCGCKCVGGGAGVGPMKCRGWCTYGCDEGGVRM